MSHILFKLSFPSFGIGPITNPLVEATLNRVCKTYTSARLAKLQGIPSLCPTLRITYSLAVLQHQSITNRNPGLISVTIGNVIFKIYI